MRFFMRGDERQWVVQNTDGTLYFFGELASDATTADAVIDFVDARQTYVFRWNLSAVVDTSGNRVEYRYARDLGQSYLQEIFWNNPPGGGSDSDLSSYQHHVMLEYEDRPDPYFSYSSGFRIETSPLDFPPIEILDRGTELPLDYGSVSFTLPPSVPPSSDGEPAVRWRLKLRGEIAYWPDVEAEFEVEVLASASS